MLSLVTNKKPKYPKIEVKENDLIETSGGTCGKVTHIYQSKIKCLVEFPDAIRMVFMTSIKSKSNS